MGAFAYLPAEMVYAAALLLFIFSVFFFYTDSQRQKWLAGSHLGCLYLATTALLLPEQREIHHIFCAQLLFHVASPLFLSSHFLLDFRSNGMIVK